MAEKKLANGTVVKVGPMLATEALLLKMRLLKVIGAGVDQLPVILAGAGPGKSDKAKEASNAAAIAAFTEIFTKGDPATMVALVEDIVGKATILRPSGAYEQADLDGDFSGNLGAAFEVVVFVLKETFGDFFSGALANLSPQTKGKRRR